MENYTPIHEIQPGQELDPYTVLRLRQAKLRGDANDEANQPDETSAKASRSAVRKAGK